MTIDPSTSSPNDIYKLIIGAVVPRPIAFVSSCSLDGILNLAPFSFFTVASANPPVVCFCPMVRGSGVHPRKDTLRNVEETGEFVVNIVSEDFVQQMNIASTDFPPEVDEFAASALTPIASDVVRPPRVKESRFNMECKLVQIVEIGTKPLGGSIVIGEVVRFHVDDSIVENFTIDPGKLQAVSRMGGPTYGRTTDRFDLERPKPPR